jgi:hypothetical protein
MTFPLLTGQFRHCPQRHPQDHARPFHKDTPSDPKVVHKCSTGQMNEYRSCVDAPSADL